MLSYETKIEAWRKFARWNACQLDVGDRSRTRANYIFDGMCEMLNYLESEEGTLNNAMKLIDEADDGFRYFGFSPRKLWRWEGLVKGLDLVLRCYTTDCVTLRSYNDKTRHLHLLIDGHY